MAERAGDTSCSPMPWVICRAVSSLATQTKRRLTPKPRSSTRGGSVIVAPSPLRQRTSPSLCCCSATGMEPLEWLGEPTGLDDPPEMRVRPALRGASRRYEGTLPARADAIGGLQRFSASENVQDQAFVSTTQALVCACVRRAELKPWRKPGWRLPSSTLLGMNCEYLVFAWPVANDAAKALGDREAMADLLSLFEAHPIGHLPPLLRAERALTKAHLAADRARGARR